MPEHLTEKEKAEIEILNLDNDYIYYIFYVLTKEFHLSLKDIKKMDLLTIKYFIRYNFREKTQKEINDFQVNVKAFNLQNMKKEDIDKSFEDFYKPRLHSLGKEYNTDIDIDKALNETEKFYKNKIETENKSYSELYGYKAALKKALDEKAKEKEKELLQQSDNNINN